MPTSDADLAIAAALAGCDVVRVRYGGTLARFDKSAFDFATEADIESENAILDVLRAARPGDAVEAEESGHTAAVAGGATGPDGAERTWLVDPLCGTLNYAARTTMVAVNVALRTNGVVTAAASADPFAREVFWTDGYDAYVRRDGTDDRLRPAAVSRLVDVDLDPPFPNRPAFQAARLLTDDGFAEHFRPRVVSTTLALAWVAAGRRAAYVGDGHPRDSVHSAAGIALCRAAGCVATGIDGLPVHTGTGGLVVAADRVTHDRLLALIRRQLAGGTH
jgi:myo-inositol-1(or 4)-monophosphatase